MTLPTIFLKQIEHVGLLLNDTLPFSRSYGLTGGKS